MKIYVHIFSYYVSNILASPWHFAFIYTKSKSGRGFKLFSLPCEYWWRATTSPFALNLLDHKTHSFIHPPAETSLCSRFTDYSRTQLMKGQWSRNRRLQEYEVLRSGVLRFHTTCWKMKKRTGMTTTISTYCFTSKPCFQLHLSVM